MGLNFLMSGGEDSKNPDPKKFEIVGYVERKPYLLLRVKYGNCTNYEGLKILLFEDTTIKEVEFWSELDPHFTESSKLIARFVPTVEGWGWAGRFINEVLL